MSTSTRHMPLSIDILGSGPVALTLTHILRLSYPSSNITLLARKKRGTKDNVESLDFDVRSDGGSKIWKYNVPVIESSCSSYRALCTATATTSISSSSSKNARVVIVTTKAYDAVEALSTLLLPPPPASSSNEGEGVNNIHILILCNGSLKIYDDFLENKGLSDIYEPLTSSFSDSSCFNIQGLSLGSTTLGSHFLASDSNRKIVNNVSLGLTSLPLTPIRPLPHADSNNVNINIDLPTLLGLPSSVSNEVITFQKSQGIYETIFLKICINALINPISAVTGCLNGATIEIYIAHCEKECGVEFWVLVDVMEVVGRFWCDRFSRDSGNLSTSDVDGEGEEDKDSFPLKRRLNSIIKATEFNKSSMLQDVENKRKTEIDYFLGFLIKKYEDMVADADDYGRVFAKSDEERDKLEKGYKGMIKLREMVRDVERSNSERG